MFRRPWVFHGVDVEWVRALIGLDVERVWTRLEDHARWSIEHSLHPGIRIAERDGRSRAEWPLPSIGRERWPARGGPGSGQAINMMRQACTEGCGFQFRFVDVAFPEIADVRAALSRAARQVLKVTLFLSAKGAGVLGAHYDSNPVGIVHLFGRKLWKVGGRSVVRYPFAEASRLNGQELLACEPKAVMLGPGSVLFFPVGILMSSQR